LYQKGVGSPWLDADESHRIGRQGDRTLSSCRLRLRLYRRLWKNFRSQPGYYFYLLRRSRAAKVRDMLSRGQEPQPGSYFPTKLNLRLLYRCNLHCVMCGQWGRRGSYFDYGKARLESVLERDVIEGVLEELVPRGLRLVDMVGGETLLYPAFGDLLQRLARRSVYVKFATNGTLLDRWANAVVEARVASITVSVDGDRATHNLIRGADWAYDRTLSGLLAVRAARQRQGRGVPLVQLGYTVSRHNGAAPLRDLCEDLRGRELIDVLEIKTTPIFVTEEAEERYVDLVEQYFEVRQGITSPGSFREDYRDFGASAEELARTIRALKNGGFDFFIEALPHIPPEQIWRLFADYAWDLGRGPCPVPYDEPTIDADGNVYPCNVFIDEPLSMGNVYRTSFMDIWHGDRFMRFRRMLKDQGGLLPICTRCCQLTEY